MPRKAPRSGPVPSPQDQDPAAQPARRDRRHANDPVSLGLRKLWEAAEKEPVPDYLLALLDAIDTARGGSPAPAASLPGEAPAKGGPS